MEEESSERTIQPLLAGKIRHDNKLLMMMICEAWIFMAVRPPDLALIDDINVSWFILWYAEIMSGELELVHVNRL